MEYALTYDCPKSSWWENLTCLFQGLARRVAATLPFTASAEQSFGETDRAATNRRAEQLLNTYGNSILRYAYSYLHNLSDAEEVLQDTLVKFLQTAPVLESPQHERAWLLRVAGNLSNNRLD